MKRTLVLVAIAALLIPSPALAKRVRYQAVDVKNGGAIKGTVTAAEMLKDPVIPVVIKPKQDPKETAVEKKLCLDDPKGQKANMYVLSPSKGVKNVLVIVEGVKKGKAAPKKDFQIDNRDCKFIPLVGIAYVKSNYVIRNSDPVLHNTNLGKVLKGGTRRAVYNLALPYKDQVIKKKNRVAGLLHVKCDAHPWMRAYIYSTRHPYVVLTDKNGNFEIKDLLPGKYKVKFWHEGFEALVKEIEVKAGQTTQSSVTFSKTIKPNFLTGG